MRSHVRKSHSYDHSVIKFLALLLVLLLVFPAGCGSRETAADTTDETDGTFTETDADTIIMETAAAADSETSAEAKSDTAAEAANETVSDTEAETDRTSTADSDKVTVTVTGSSGSIQLTIPDGWSYTICPEGSESLELTAYAIQFYPDDTGEGCIEVGYLAGFSINSSSLIEEEITLAGDTAIMGTFEDQTAFSYITWQGTYAGVCAIADTAGSWLTDSEDEVLEILDTLQFSSSDSSADSVSSAEDSLMTLPLTVTCTVLDVSDGILTLQIDNQSGTVFTYDAVITLEVEEDGEWVEVPFLETAEWIDVAYELADLATTTCTFDLNAYFGELPSGNYRVTLSGITATFSI